MRQTTLAVLAAVGLALGVSTGVGAAAPRRLGPTTAHVVVTCINKITGVMRVKPAKHTCRANEVKRSWLDPLAVRRLVRAGASAGMVGPTGDAGATGATGATGPAGANGRDGVGEAPCTWVLSSVATSEVHSACTGHGLIGLALDAMTKYADLSGSDLRGSRFADSDFTGANLSGTNLAGASLPNAHLTGANLTGANLTGANLSSVVLSGATLTNVNFTNADLQSTDFDGVNVLDLASVTWTGAQCPNGGGVTNFVVHLICEANRNA